MQNQPDDSDRAFAAQAIVEQLTEGHELTPSTFVSIAKTIAAYQIPASALAEEMRTFVPFEINEVRAHSFNPRSLTDGLRAYTVISSVCSYAPVSGCALLELRAEYSRVESIRTLHA